MLFTTVVNHALSRFGLRERGNAPFPRQPTPMLVEKAATLFDNPDWTYEPKWDGFRVLASVRDGSVRLISRKGHSFTNLFWPVSDALRGFPTSILLDGEVIAICSRNGTVIAVAPSFRTVGPSSTPMTVPAVGGGLTAPLQLDQVGPSIVAINNNTATPGTPTFVTSPTVLTCF